MQPPGKANMVADALSRREASTAAMLVHEWSLLEQLSHLTILDFDSALAIYCAYMVIRSDLVDQIRNKQQHDERLGHIMANMDKFCPLGYNMKDDGLLLYQGRICVPVDEELRHEILSGFLRICSGLVC